MAVSIGVNDVTDYLQVSWETGTAPSLAASAIIDGLEADLRGWLRRPLAVAQFVERSPDVRVTGGGLLRVTQTPVVEVLSLSVDGRAAVLGSEFDLRREGIAYFGPRWGYTDLVVDYRAGLTGDDPGSDFGSFLRSQMIRKAAAVCNKVVREDQAGLDSLSVEGTTYRWSSAAGETWADDELKRFARFRRRVKR